jgi:hypothetical protein
MANAPIYAIYEDSVLHLDGGIGAVFGVNSNTQSIAHYDQDAFVYMGELAGYIPTEAPVIETERPRGGGKGQGGVIVDQRRSGLTQEEIEHRNLETLLLLIGVIENE